MWDSTYEELQKLNINRFIKYGKNASWQHLVLVLVQPLATSRYDFEKDFLYFEVVMLTTKSSAIILVNSSRAENDFTNACQKLSCIKKSYSS